MKRLIIFLQIIALSIGLNNKVQAQKVWKYKDVYEIVVQGNDEVSYPILLNYQAQDPKHANTYFHLGEIAYKMVQQQDPFVDYEILKYYQYQAKVYYGLAKLYIDEKEVKKNDEMYFGVTKSEGNKRVSFFDVQLHIEKRLSWLETHDKQIRNIRDLLYGANTHYKSCIQIFTDIISQNSKEKDLYMSQDEVLIANTKKLKEEFAATLQSLDDYKKAIAAYPIGNYKQDYELKPIKTYRLEGLLSSNFFANKIVLWDYAQWVNNLNATQDNEVNGLRENIASAYETINTELKKIDEELFSIKEFKEFKLDEKLINQIEKFDYGSMLSSYFEYLENKVNYYKFTNSMHNNLELDTLSTILQTARYYRDLVDIKLQIDSVFNIAESDINEKGYTKYRQFIDEKFKSLEGFKFTLNEDKEENNRMLNNSFRRLNQFVVKDLQGYSEPGKYIALNKTDSLALFKSLKTGQDGNHSLLFEKTNNGIWFTGLKRKGNKVSVFLTHASDTGTIISHNVFKNISDVDCFSIEPTKMEFADNNLFVLYHAIPNNRADSIHSILARFDLNGKLIKKITLATINYPRYLRCDDVNKQFLVVYKGFTAEENLKEAEDLVTVLYDENGEIVWKNVLNVQGSFADVVKFADNYLVYINFTHFTFKNQNVQSKTNAKGLDQMNVVLNYIDKNGESKSLPTYSLSSPFYVTRVLKLDSETINIIGYRGTHQIKSEINHRNRQQLFYMLTDQNGKSFYSN